MRSRRAKWSSVAVFAVLLNLGGGPMAWAHLLNGGCHDHAAAAQSDCPDHAPAQTAPCCDGGNCSCAVPALSAALASEWTRIPFDSASVPLDFTSLPSRLPDDTLRPPIR